ncbi:acyl carrier protein [Streptomyces phaeochromogenes]
MWDERFEEIVRRYLPFLGPEELLDEDATLRDLGLDSLGTVELLSALENAYGLRLADDALTMETFATPATLWAVLRDLSAPAV